MNNTIWKIIIIVGLIIGGIFYFTSSNTKITLDPREDAKTCVRLYERNPEKAQEYIQTATYKYYQEGKRSELDKFLSIATKEIARKSFE